jgi:hypothetical protein
MSSFGGLILTNKGRALQAKVQAGAILHFTRIGVGDGNLGSQSIPDLNALISEKKSLAITKLKTQSGGKAVVGGVLSNQDVTVGFYFREIGLFAQDPDVGEILYCYANAGAGAEYIAPGGGPDVIEKTIDIIAITANAATVTATLDSSLVYASQEDLQDHISDRNNPHQVTAAQVGAIPVTALGQPGGVAPLDATGKVPTSNLPSLNYVPQSQVGQPNGVASLDSSGKVPQSQLPAMNYIPTSAQGAANGVATLDASGKVPTTQIPAATASAIGGVKTSGSNGVAVTTDDPVYTNAARKDQANTFSQRQTVPSLALQPQPTPPTTAGVVSQNNNRLYVGNGTAAVGIPTLGANNQSVEKFVALIQRTDTRSLILTYNNGQLTQITENDGGTTVKTTTLTYSGGNLTQVQETVGGNTITTTLTYTNGQLTSVSRSVQ